MTHKCMRVRRSSFTSILRHALTSGFAGRFRLGFQVDEGMVNRCFKGSLGRRLSIELSSIFSLDVMLDSSVNLFSRHLIQNPGLCCA